MHRPTFVTLAAVCIAALAGCSSNLETPAARYAAAVRARAAFENGDLRRARSLFGDLAAGTRDASAWANLALAQYRSDKTDAALRSWSRAVQFDASCAPAQYWLGMVRFAQGREARERASSDAKHAAQLEEKAGALWREAAHALEAAAAADPAEPVILASLAEVYDALGQQANAKRAREGMLRLDPTRRATLAASGLESPCLPPRPRPTTAGQIPMRFEPEILPLRSARVTAADPDGMQSALFLAPSGTVWWCDSVPEGHLWHDRGRLTPEDVQASTNGDLDGDGTNDLLYVTCEASPADQPAGSPEAASASLPLEAAAPAAKAKRTNAGHAAVRAPMPESKPARIWWAPGSGTPRLLGEVPEGVTLVRLADLDCDGDLDLLLGVGGKPAVRVWRNEASRFVALDPVPAGIDALPPLTDLVAADFDGDGRTDLVAVDRGGRLRVLVQRADGAFTAVTDMAGLYLERARGVAAADVDGDGNTDLVIGNDAGLWIYTNRGMARFARQAAYRVLQTTWSAEAAPAVAVAALAVTDLDNDGTCDVLTLHPALPPAGNPWIAVARPGTTPPAGPAGTKPPVEDTAPELPLPALPSAALLRIWRNDGRGVLFETTESFAADTLRCALPVIADLDRDGDRDLAWIRADSTLVVHWNEGGNANRRILVALAEASGAQAGAGARLEVHAGDFAQGHEVTAQPVWIGVERRTRLDVVRVRWPDGGIQNWLDLELPADGRLRLQRAVSAP